MKTYTLRTEYANYNVVIRKTQYANNGNLALLLETPDGEPVANLTVNLPDEILASNCAYLDTNNLPEAEWFVQSNGLAKPTGEYGNSGYCSYPLYEFDLDKLGE